VSVSSERVESANEGKLVHMTGEATTDEQLADTMFGIEVNAIKLSRAVEMYQWEEDESTQKKKKLGGGETTETTYDYRKTWHAGRIDSSGFEHPEGHENPQPAVSGTQWTAKRVTIGAFALNSGLIASIDADEDLPVSDSILDSIAEEDRGHFVLHDGQVYRGIQAEQVEPTNPQVGDLRIRFRVVRPTTVSLYSQQTGETFQPYQTKAGGAIQRLQVGSFSAEAMFEQAQRENTMLTWGLRLAGFVLMAIGFALVFKPFSVFADVIPLLGSLVGAGFGLVAMLLAGVLSLITIAIAWLFYRPVLAVSLLLAAGLLIGALVFFMAKRSGKPTK